VAESAKKIHRRKPRGLRLAIVTVLEDANGALSPKEIWAEVKRRKLHTSHGKTPEATVSAILYRHNEFRKTSPGRFALREAP
jgi:hypothetical protein